MSNDQSENLQHKICGYLHDAIPIVQTDGVTDEQAKIAAANISKAYLVLAGVLTHSYYIQFETHIQEIQIVTKVNNKSKYHWYIENDKAIIKMAYDIMENDACQGFGAAMMNVIGSQSK